MHLAKTLVLAAAAASLAHAANAQVTFYEWEGLRGQAFTADRPINDLERYGFNDRASSVIVQSGQWQACTDAYFHGQCVVLRPGQYPSLAAMGMNNRISSLRRVQGGPHYVYAPPPPPVPPPYPYHPVHGEPLYQANVIAVRAVMGPPEQRCWVEQQQVYQENKPNVGGAVLGGILGGVLGHQIGNGRGNDVATAVGAVGGAAIGANVNRGGQSYTQNVQRCEAVPGTGKPAYWDVTYVFQGQQHRAQLQFAPGDVITVNGRGEPRV